MTEPSRDPCPIAAQSVTCEQCTEFLLDYIDDLLPAERRFQFESHLALCADCKVYVDNYRKAAELARASGQPVEQVTAEKVPPALVAAILAARKRQS